MTLLINGSGDVGRVLSWTPLSWTSPCCGPLVLVLNLGTLSGNRTMSTTNSREGWRLNDERFKTSTRFDEAFEHRSEQRGCLGPRLEVVEVPAPRGDCLPFARSSHFVFICVKIGFETRKV